MMDEKWIFAYFYENDYVPEGIFESIDAALKGVEYSDVKSSQYQLWHYPSGEIFAVESDKEVNDIDTWSTAESAIWYPRLRKVDVNVDKIIRAYKALTSK